MDNKDKEWPSERVPKGGLLHPPKVEYSKDTRDLIKLLMDESRLTMMHRKRLNYYLRNGESLPLPISMKPAEDQSKANAAAAAAARRMGRVGRRKNHAEIEASGAYECPKYQPKPDSREEIEKAKIRLQESMSGMKMYLDSGEAKKKLKPKEKVDVVIEPNDLIDELLQEIAERADWLEDMEQLGEGKKHREVIHLEIADRLREIKQIDRRAKMRQKSLHRANNQK